LAKDIAAAIRDVDPLTPILVGPAAYNAALNLPSLPFREFKKFAPVVFCAHQYSPSDYTESAKTNYGPEEKRIWTSVHDNRRLSESGGLRARVHWRIRRRAMGWGRR